MTSWAWTGTVLFVVFVLFLWICFLKLLVGLFILGVMCLALMWSICAVISAGSFTRKKKVFCCHNAKWSSDLGKKTKSNLPRLRLLTCSAVILTNESAAYLENPMAGSPLNHSIVGRAVTWRWIGESITPGVVPSPEHIHRPTLVSLVSKNRIPLNEALYHGVSMVYCF